MASAASGITPAADLIAEAPEAHRPAAADRADGGEATPSSVAVRHRRDLDHETSVRYPHLERGVVQTHAGRLKSSLEVTQAGRASTSAGRAAS